jgi:hypothetical protein
MQEGSMGIYDPPTVSHDVVISGTATGTDQDSWGEARRIIERYRAVGGIWVAVERRTGAAIPPTRDEICVIFGGP